jgi:riboflavin kinase / FMN adenylyltransferase
MAQRVVTIGNFDGVHIGHAALVARARRVATRLDRKRASAETPTDAPTEAPTEAPTTVTVLTFDPHPISILRPGVEPARLTTFAQRERLLKELGADEVIRLTPTADLLNEDPETFVRWVLDQADTQAIVEGDDFRFGKGRRGDRTALTLLGASLGFDVEIVDPVEAALTDQTIVRASSTTVRWLVEHGRVRDAAAVLGRPYVIAGEVVEGDRRGRTIGFPTANFVAEQLLPADGVYAGWATLDDGRRFKAAVSVGTKPMFDGVGRTAEAFLIDAPNETAPNETASHETTPIADERTTWGRITGLPEYGWRVEVELIAWVRDQSRFGSIDALTDQIERDCTKITRLLTAMDEQGGAANGISTRPSVQGASV